MSNPLNEILLMFGWVLSILSALLICHQILFNMEFELAFYGVLFAVGVWMIRAANRGFFK